MKTKIKMGHGLSGQTIVRLNIYGFMKWKLIKYLWVEYLINLCIWICSVVEFEFN